jgi:hypothetical protein
VLAEAEGRSAHSASPPPAPALEPSPSTTRRPSAVRILSDEKELEEALRRAAIHEQQLLERITRLASHYNR